MALLAFTLKTVKIVTWILVKMVKSLQITIYFRIQKYTPQIGLFNALADQPDQKQPLYLLANVINWAMFEDSFKKHYSEKMGKPSEPIR